MRVLSAIMGIKEVSERVNRRAEKHLMNPNGGIRVHYFLYFRRWAEWENGKTNEKGVNVGGPTEEAES